MEGNGAADHETTVSVGFWNRSIEQAGSIFLLEKRESSVDFRGVNMRKNLAHKT